MSDPRPLPLPLPRSLDGTAETVTEADASRAETGPASAPGLASNPAPTLPFRSTLTSTHASTPISTHASTPISTSPPAPAPARPPPAQPPLVSIVPSVDTFMRWGLEVITDPPDDDCPICWASLRPNNPAHNISTGTDNAATTDTTAHPRNTGIHGTESSNSNTPFDSPSVNHSGTARQLSCTSIPLGDYQPSITEPGQTAAFEDYTAVRIKNCPPAENDHLFHRGCLREGFRYSVERRHCRYDPGRGRCPYCQRDLFVIPPDTGRRAVTHPAGLLNSSPGLPTIDEAPTHIEPEYRQGGFGRGRRNASDGYATDSALDTGYPHRGDHTHDRDGRSLTQDMPSLQPSGSTRYTTPNSPLNNPPDRNNRDEWFSLRSPPSLPDISIRSTRYTTRGGPPGYYPDPNNRDQWSSLFDSPFFPGRHGNAPIGYHRSQTVQESLGLDRNRNVPRDPRTGGGTNINLGFSPPLVRNPYQREIIASQPAQQTLEQHEALRQELTRMGFNQVRPPWDMAEARRQRHEVEEAQLQPLPFETASRQNLLPRSSQLPPFGARMRGMGVSSASLPPRNPQRVDEAGFGNATRQDLPQQPMTSPWSSQLPSSPALISSTNMLSTTLLALTGSPTDNNAGRNSTRGNNNGNSDQEKDKCVEE